MADEVPAEPAQPEQTQPEQTQPEQALPEYVRGLLEPAAYPHPPERVELVQTHISYVFLAGEDVYKTKKPVDFGFIDQVAPERRERFCHDEVRLNRRLAAGIYLDVAPVVRTPEGYRVDPPGGASAGEVVEWAVHMRRLPDERTLDRLLAAGAVPETLPEALVRRLVQFHEAAEVVPNDPAFAGAEGERGWWAREYGEAAGFIGDTWDEADAAVTRAYVDRTIEANAALFDERLVAGRVVEGHGDLRAAHVYLLGDLETDASSDADDESIAIVDCIEFTDWFHFRYLDVGYDIAFLAMDLEAMGRPDLGEELAGRYLAATRDETLGVLQPLHRLFRAFVRGKVESIGAHAAEVPEAQRRDLAASAARYFRLAATYAERSAGPAVIAMCGLPGTGKSTVAGTLACRIGAAYLSSDAIRKELAGLDPRTRAEAGYREGLYTPEMHERTYAELRRRARAHLAAGRPVILDAMHGRAAERDAARALAEEAAVPFVVAALQLTEEAARARISGRSDDPFRTSDATWEVYTARAADFEPPGPHEGLLVGLDASLPPAEQARRVAEALPASV